MTTIVAPSGFIQEGAPPRYEAIAKEKGPRPDAEAKPKVKEAR
jgi:hypothetical protein